MKLSRKWIECIAVVVFVITLTVVAAGQNTQTDMNENTEFAQSILNNSTRAGIALTVVPEKKSVVESKEVAVVSESKAEEVKDIKEVKETSEWDERVLVDVKSVLNVRAKASGKAKVVGVMMRGTVAEILSEKDEWYKIESGDVTGFIKKEYCVTGEKAEKFARKLGCFKAVAKENGLRVRKEASTEAGIYKVLLKGEKISLASKDSKKEGWIKVVFDGKKAYVSADYVKVSLELDKAMTMDEYNKMLEEAKKAEEAKRASASNSSNRSQRAEVSADVDDVTLLAALIYCEAGNQPYEGKLAVGAVVCNRIRSSSYPNTLHGVIYQSGQFGPAHSGILARRLNRRSPSSCVRAAREALSGVDNVGGRLHFLPVRSGRRGLVIGDHVFF